MADADDPALAEIERLRREFPELPMQALVAGPPGQGNAKVALLEALARTARHETLLATDADVRLAPHDLRRMAGELTREVGLVTALYRARSGKSWASRLDAAWISCDFPGQALSGAYLAGVSFALGAAMLFRRADLERIGGFQAIRPYLADDYELGARIAALGAPVRLSSVAVETVLGETGWGDLWRRHLRWSRTIRASRPGGHAGFATTFGMLWSLLLLAAGGPGWPAAACPAARALPAAPTRAPPARSGAVAPAAELWAAAVWAASFAGRSVNWRGRTLLLDASGRIVEGPD